MANAIVAVIGMLAGAIQLPVRVSRIQATGVSRSRFPIRMVAQMPAASESSLALPAERYVASNRFRVKEGREAAFEKRWADRKSKLGLLDGFRFFCMLRRVADDGAKPYEDDINYISCTVWESFANFDAWKKGSAFKEAHGGGTIGGVASMLLATAMNTKGKPKPAMWEGILPVSGELASPTPGGWQQVVADGVAKLDAESFVAMNRFSVKEGCEPQFEKRFASRESKLSSFDGFKGFILLRRDNMDDGFNYSTFSIWKNKAAFDAWRGAENRAGKPKAPPAAPPGAEKPARPEIFLRPPVASFYEGILCVESAKGI